MQNQHDRRLQGRVALVFGAGSSGTAMSNGRAAALVFAREGAVVAAIDRDVDEARRTADLIVAEGGSAIPLVADVTVEDDVAAAVAAARRELGVPSILHNNVGAAVTGDVTDLDLTVWEAALARNVGGVFLACKYAIPHLLESGHGAIVNVSSLAAIRWTGYSYPAYMAGKAAVNQLTVAVALRYAAEGLRANAVVPGVIDTPLGSHLATEDDDATADEREVAATAAAAHRDAMSPTGRSGTPWDVARVAAFLASDDAGYVNGVCLPVDGGMAARCG